MYIIKILVFVTIFQAFLSTATILTLYTQPTSQKLDPQHTQIPEIHDHPYSCQLVFFNVIHNQFIAEIIQIGNNITQIKLTVWTYQQKLFYYNDGYVKDNKVIFLIKFPQLNQTTNLQIIMNFNLSYQINGDIQVVQQRKAYILFSQTDQDDYIFRLPSGTIILTTTIGLFFILILPWNIQYRRFLPFTYNLLTSSFYIIILIIAMYAQILFGKNDTVFIIQRIIIGIFQFTFMVMYSQDLLMKFSDRNWITFVIGLLFTSSVMVLDNFVDEVKDSWFLNDIIAIMISGAFIKFVIIRKMNSGVWAFAVMWFFCIFREFAKQLHVQKFDQGFGIRVLPIFVQLPSNWIDNSSSLSCSAFGSSKIISFGIILNFCYRLDIIFSTKFYRILSILLTIICVISQLIFNLIIDDLPTIQVMSIIIFYPLAIGFILFFANKRGEWAQVWNGSFYDLAVNRPTIARNVSFQGLEQQFGKDLVINSESIAMNYNTVCKNTHLNTIVGSIHKSSIKSFKASKLGFSIYVNK